MGSEDFKSFSRALDPSGVGSIPTRSRQSCFWPVLFLGLVVVAAPVRGAGIGALEPADPGETADSRVAENPPAGADSLESAAPPEVADPFDVPAPAVAPAPGETRTSAARKTGNRRDGGPSIGWVTVRSGVLPGWGQLANRKPLKAVFFGGVYAGFAVSALVAESDRGGLQDRIDREGGEPDPALVDRLNNAVNRRNFGMWMMGATMVFSMLDAYVDAHFFNYDDQWRAGPVFDGGLVAVSMGCRF